MRALKDEVSTPGSSLRAPDSAGRGQHSPLTSLGLGPPLISPGAYRRKSVRSLEGGNQLPERANHQTPDPTLSNLHHPLVSPNSGSQILPSSSSSFCFPLFDALTPLRPPPTHPATRMITRRGSPATVIKKSAKAGPNATKVHPKNTAAPMAGQLGAG